MGGDAFSETSLTEKLTKLNSSQQSIESLSRWCISHRRKAKQVVETWRAVFKSVSQERRVSLLYLANDILQISRRKGSEFVNEFWKVLPMALKGVYDSGEENCKKVASRLVDIWAERKVFGSKGQNLKNELTGNNSSSPGKNPALVNVNVGNDVNPIKVLKRDANSLRIKLSVGGVPEKIVTAFQLVLDETVNEEEALNECRNTVLNLRDKENDVNFSSAGNLLVGSDAVSEIQKQEDTLQQSITQLEKIEATRVSLVSQLREALQDQESKLELIQRELHTARGQIEKTANMKFRLTLISSTPPPTANQEIIEPSFTPAQAQPQPTDNPSLGTPTHPQTSFAKSTISEEESNRATAAAVAARLTASTSSAQMLSSVLSSLVAEEAALNGQVLKRPKLEQPMLPSGGNNPELANQVHFQAPFLPPPPPPWANRQSPYARPGPPPQQSQPSQVPVSGGYYGPVSVGFYGQGHQPPAPANDHQ